MQKVAAIRFFKYILEGSLLSYTFLGVFCMMVRLDCTEDRYVFHHCCHSPRRLSQRYTAKKFRFVYSEKRNCAASVPNFHKYVSLSNLYIPTIGPPIFLKQNRQTDCGNIFLFSGHEPIYFIENKEKTLRASYDRGTQIFDYMD